MPSAVCVCVGGASTASGGVPGGSQLRKTLCDLVVLVPDQAPTFFVLERWWRKWGPWRNWMIGASQSGNSLVPLVEDRDQGLHCNLPGPPGGGSSGREGPNGAPLRQSNFQLVGLAVPEKFLLCF